MIFVYFYLNNNLYPEFTVYHKFIMANDRKVISVKFNQDQGEI